MLFLLVLALLLQKILITSMASPFLLYFKASSRFVRYCWTDEELITATGNLKYTKLKHPLKLKSSYPTLKVTEFAFFFFALILSHARSKT